MPVSVCSTGWGAGGGVGLAQDAGREERVDRAQAREGEPALGPAEAPDGDAPLGEVEDLELLRRAAARLEREGRHLGQHDAAVEVAEALQDAAPGSSSTRMPS